MPIIDAIFNNDVLCVLQAIASSEYLTCTNVSNGRPTTQVRASASLKCLAARGLLVENDKCYELREPWIRDNIKRLLREAEMINAFSVDK